MLIVLAVAAAAALVVAAYHRLRHVAPEAGVAGLRAVKDLADVVIVCVKAIEGVLAILGGPARITASVSRQWDDGTPYEDELGLDDEFDPDHEQL